MRRKRIEIGNRSLPSSVILSEAKDLANKCVICELHWRGIIREVPRFARNDRKVGEFHELRSRNKSQNIANGF